jgi:hypothetical protein
MIFISEPQRHSGNSAESGMSRRSNFDTLCPLLHQSYVTAAALTSSVSGIAYYFRRSTAGLGLLTGHVLRESPANGGLVIGGR